jgi:hypothetical protein
LAEGLGKRFREKALASRSGAYRWLRENHAEIMAEIAAQKRPSWQALAETAADEGKTFTSNALRFAWKRLEQDLAWASRPAQPPLPSPAFPAPRPASRANPVTDDDDDLLTGADGTVLKPPTL